MTAPVRILLVEDSPDDATLITHALRRAAPDIVVERVDSAPALRTALECGYWDAVISDWSLPGFSAIGALAVVRAAGLDLPFVIVSGTIGEELAVESMRAGAHDYVLKDQLARLAPAVEREIREAKLRASHRRTELRFRALIEKSAEAVLLTEVDGAITYASPAATPIFGSFPEELLGRRFSTLLHPGDRAAVMSALGRLHSDRTIGAPIECRAIRSDDSIRWIAVTGTNLLDEQAVEAIVLNVRDVTERRRAADALRASEERFARLSESGIIGILTADTQGKLLDANDTYLNMIGFTRAEALADTFNWIDLMPPDELDATARVSAQLVERGYAPPWETAVIRKDGTRLPMLVGMAILEHPTTIAFCVDLTERKRAEEALRKSEEHLRQAQKMEAVGRLAGGVAHDFNNVLSIVLSYAEMLKDALAEDDPKRADVNEICAAGWRAAELTRQLLMFSRQQVLEPKILDLNEVLANMDKMLRRVLGEDVEFVTLRAKPLGRIKADPSSIEQVLMNLVVNARDAMPVGGKLTLETANVMLDDDHVRRHAATTAGPHVMLSVTDTGIGMDPATQARIFDPFFTTKPKDKGTGLGLSTVFGIVQQSGGSISVYSELGRGTTFEIYLPRAEGKVESARAGATAPLGGSETILLVEDEEQVRIVAREILRRHGYVVLEARDAAAALHFGEHHAGEIDLLLTDVVMPLMSGPELTKRFEKLRPAVKVLCMSGYTDDSIVRHGILNSDIAFLQKPFTPESLTRKVREALDAAPRRG